MRVGVLILLWCTVMGERFTDRDLFLLEHRIQPIARADSHGNHRACTQRSDVARTHRRPEQWPRSQIRGAQSRGGSDTDWARPRVPPPARAGEEARGHRERSQAEAASAWPRKRAARAALKARVRRGGVTFRGRRKWSRGGLDATFGSSAVQAAEHKWEEKGRKERAELPTPPQSNTLLDVATPSDDGPVVASSVGLGTPPQVTCERKGREYRTSEVHTLAQ